MGAFVQRLVAVALAALVFWSPCVPMRAFAQDDAPRDRFLDTATDSHVDELESVGAGEEPASSHELREELGDTELAGETAEALEQVSGATEPEPQSEEEAQEDAQPLALPTGPAKSGVTPQNITLPQGEGAIQGMGESFTPQLSSGTGTFSVPIALPKGRNGVGPSLALSYSTSGGNGPLGVGWSLGAPFISRQTDKGLPRYVDAQAWHEEEDRFMYNGGQELVPVDSAEATAVDGAPVPAYAATWQQYRTRVEGAFMRFFRAPDSSRWIVQSKDGTLFELGACTDALGRCDGHAVDADPEQPSRIFAWHLVRMSDVHGSAVHYRYVEDEGHVYLSTIYYDSPAQCAVASVAGRRGCTASLADYGRRVQLVYEAREDVTTSYLRTWEVRTGLRLKRVEVTSAQGSVGSRYLVRRYHLAYDPASFHSMLTSVQVEGRPSRYDAALGVYRGRTDVAESSLGDALVGDLLPPMRFSYTGVKTPGAPGIAGFGVLDETVRKAPVSPRHSVDEARTDLFDVNSDGLPDLVVTDPSNPSFRNGAGVYFNGFAGTSPARPGSFSSPVKVVVPAGLSGVMTLSNVNILPMDVDGDGRTDLLNMPRQRRYGYFAVSKEPASGRYDPLKGFSFQYVERDLGQGLDPRIDLGRDGLAIKTVDVNHDSLIDIVQTTGSKLHTWLNLGFVPGGDGRFGSAHFDGQSWKLSTAPVDTCLPFAGRTLDFADENVRFADMNGDGLVDIVRLGFGEVLYWPSRGEGAWGRGSHDCDQTNRSARHVSMVDAPRDINVELDGVHLVDVNADGASDLVQVGATEVSVWFNRTGHGFTERVVLRNTPFRASAIDRVRIADIDGTGTPDIIYGSANDFKWLDLAGGQRPRLLETVDNGLGALTTLKYGSSAEDYLRDLAEARQCNPDDIDCFTWHREPRASASARAACDDKGGGCIHHPAGSAMISTVVRSVTTTDRFDAFGLPANVVEKRFRYHDAYYEGIEQEFRGFGAADAETVGDVYEPTGFNRTFFHQGRRPNAIAADRLADNPNEALKGREYLTEAHAAANGMVATSSHATYAVRRLLTGLNGVRVSYAYVKRTDEYRYDTTDWVPTSAREVLPSVVREVAEGAIAAVSTGPADEGDAPHALALHGARHVRLESTFDQVDNVGSVLRQTAWGRNGRGGAPDERITQVTIPVRIDDSTCGGSGWLWRTSATHVEGHGDEGIQLKRSTFSHNACGDLVLTEMPALLPASPAFSFASPAGALSYVQTNLTSVSSTRHDVWGQPVESCVSADLRTAGPADCDRHGTITYDASYGALVEQESVAAALSGPGTALVSTATWDEGVGLLESATDPNGLVSEVFYDGHGRLTGLLRPNVLGCAGRRVPTQRFFYDVPADPASRPVSRVHSITELSCDGIEEDMLLAYAYVDGLGRTRAMLTEGDSDPESSEDGGRHPWSKSGVQLFNAKGKPCGQYETDHYDGTPADLAEALAPPPRVPVLQYSDAFGRPWLTRERDGVVVTEVRHHELSTEVRDGVQRGEDPSAPWCFTGGYTLNEVDGHGRPIHQQLHYRRGTASCTDVAQFHHLFSYYRADGAVTKVVRALAPRDMSRPLDNAFGALTRWTARTFIYDSQSRRIASFDPNTDNLAEPDLGKRSWRYLYNRAGDLAAVRDPRGCGQNFFYDRAGRLTGEQYVTCAEAQLQGELAADTVPVGSLGATRLGSPANVQVRYYFDAYPGWSASWALPGERSGVLGLATGTADRAQRSVMAYDDRGQPVYGARQMAIVANAGTYTSASGQTGSVPNFTEGAESARPNAYDTARTYESRATYDHAGRSRSTELPIDPDFVGGGAPLLGGELAYDDAGRPTRASVLVGAARHDVVGNISYTHDQLPSVTTYGDTRNGRQATTSTQLYDVRRRPSDMFTLRDPTVGAEPQTLGAVSVVSDLRLQWDTVNNLIAVYDERPGAEWPDGHRPQTTQVFHDSLYRVERIKHRYTDDDDDLSQVDTATDWRTTAADHQGADPMKERPAPMLPSAAPSRVAQLDYTHDWLANVTSFGDDARQFYERSLGSVANGTDLAPTTTNLRPSALYLASNLSSANPADRGGWLELAYGAGGNVTSMTVRARCTNNGALLCMDPAHANLEARRSTMRGNCSCASQQHYSYRYDELNRLSEARRFDREGTVWVLKVRQRYRYDAANQRTIKETRDIASNDTRATLYVAGGDFERRGLRVTDAGYTAIAGETESQYLIAGARVVWQSNASLIPGIDPDHRITFAVTNLIQSTSAVIDLMSGDLLEATGFYPNGAREHWLDSSSVNAQSVPLEPIGFTGKEGDDEVGLTYFGERYLIQHIGRWATPDPLAIHAAGGGEVLNAYHYISGNLLQGRDPLGLSEPEDAPAYTPDPGYVAMYQSSVGQPPMQAAQTRAEAGMTDSKGTWYARSAVAIGGAAVLPGLVMCGGEVAVATVARHPVLQTVAEGGTEALLEEAGVVGTMSLGAHAASKLAGEGAEQLMSSADELMSLADEATFTLTDAARIARKSEQSLQAVDPARSVALGVGDHLDDFARGRGMTWLQWTGNLTRRSVDERGFGRALTDALDNAEAIHFNLDGIKDVREAFLQGRAGFNYYRDSIGELIVGNATNTELTTVMRDPVLLAKTLFYREGKVVDAQAVLKEALGQ